ncbi:pentapeptide repeat-containing protein [Azospirillum sp. TSO22-1]|uniref:pentapeptide repeat-containing protein n=1 Tax=Azospirillum sp. TSO22-1 TaxID=716789 RepID=UPI000D64DB0F|nr:pentapeptide repeat-containing protein [Azospirillum sp. TSO22-1]
MADVEELLRLQAGDIDFAHTDLREADLSGMDLSARIFIGAHLEKAVARGTRFRRAKVTDAHMMQLDAASADFSEAEGISTSYWGVNFSGANFSKSNFSRSRFEKVNFDRVNFRGADFRDAVFEEGTSFKGAFADANTLFDGATIFRPLAKEDVFRFYRVELGKLVRITDAEERPEQFLRLKVISQPGIDAAAPASSVAVIRQKIASQSNEVSAMAAALAFAIDEHLDELAEKKPNDPQALEFHEQYTSFLSAIADGLRQIHAALLEASKEVVASKKEEKLSLAALTAKRLGDEVRSWIDDNGKLVIDYGAKTGMLGIGTSFLSLCGIPAWEAFIPLATVVGGGTFREGIEALKGLKGRKSTSKAKRASKEKGATAK